MKKNEKKTWPKLFDEVKSGKKNFEVRLADWHCRPGDILVLREWNPKTKQYTGRVIEKKVAYVLKTKGLKFFTKKDIEKYGYQIIAFK
jgi:ASC-1-like (ASCH) protein